MKTDISIKRQILYDVLKKIIKTEDGRKYKDMTEEEKSAVLTAFDEECNKRGIR